MKYTNNTIRINFVFIICIVLLFVLFFGKLYYVGTYDIVEGSNLESIATSRTQTTKTLYAKRGNILDSASNILAQNVNSYTLIAYLSSSRTEDERYPKHVVDKETTASKLAEVFLSINDKMTYEYIYERLNVEGKYQVEFGTYGKNLSELDKQKIEQLDLPGIDFVKSSKRYYQNGDFASYIIGYAKKDEETGEFKGELGIEKFCDRYLKGKDGEITYQHDAYGYQLADKVSKNTPAEDGYDVYLTLDKQVQIFLDNAVSEFNEYDPSWVTLTVADAKTGAIIGSSTSPSFNPNKLNIENYNDPLISYTYEPGSTMKIFSFASAIEENLYDGSETYKSGTVEVADYKIKDWNKVGWGNITYDTGFTYSSNVAAVNLSKRLKKQGLYKYYSNLGFGEKTGIELANEYKGDIDFEYDTEVASASYGQGITITPIQMIQALTSLTNDGTVLKPYVIEKIVDPNTKEVVYQGGKREVNKVYSTSTVNKVKELMDLTVNGEDKSATGRVYHTDAVRLIGKTGTANYTNESGSYVTGDYNVIRSFAGIFPKDDPEYIIYVAVKDFHGSSKNMGNIVKKLVESVAKYKNLDTRISDKDASKIVTISNYLNKTITQATSSLSSIGISPIIIGNGSRVIKQYPNNNTTTYINSKVLLLTNGNEITMPDITNWSENEVINFCNLIGLKYNFNNYGYVTSFNIEVGSIIDIENQILEVNLENINPNTYNKKESEEHEEENQ